RPRAIDRAAVMRRLLGGLARRRHQRRELAPERRRGGHTARRKRRKRVARGLVDGGGIDRGELARVSAAALDREFESERRDRVAGAAGGRFAAAGDPLAQRLGG